MGLPKLERNPQVPDFSARRKQGTAARIANLERAREAVMRGVLPRKEEIIPTDTAPQEVQKTPHFPRIPFALPAAAALAFLTLACQEATAGGGPVAKEIPDKPGVERTVKPDKPKPKELTPTPVLPPTATLTPESKPKPKSTPEPKETPTPLPMPELIPLEQIPGKIDELINKIKPRRDEKPLNPRQDQIGHVTSVGTIVDFLNQAKEALAKGDVNTARLKIGFANNSIYNLGEDSKMIPIPPEVKTRHDPKGKYMGIPIIDPRIMDEYLAAITLLVSIDPEYLAAAGKG